MAKKDEIDIDEEIKKLSRKTDLEIKKTDYSFTKRIQRLDNEMDNILNKKIKDFDDNKKITEKYLLTEYPHDTIDRYREKLKKI
jgi:hypothetical protein